MTTSVSKNVVKVVALAVAALALMPAPGASAGASGTDRQLSIDCNADQLAGGQVTYNVVANPGDTISIENLGGCDAHLFNAAFVSEVTPPSNPTIVYQVADPLAAGDYTGVVGDLGSEWPIVLGTFPQPTSWISLKVVEPNAAPKAANDHYEIIQNDTVKLDVLSNDSDADSDELSISEISPVVGGKASVVDVGGTDKVKFDPNDKFTGTASFEYLVSDGNGGSDTARVQIEVFPRFEFKAKLYGPTDSVRSGATVKLRGELEPPVTRSAGRVAGRAAEVHAELQKRTDDGWKKIDRVGLYEPAFVFKTEVKKSTAYRAVVPGNMYFERAVTNVVKVEVRKPAPKPDPKVVDVSVSRKTVKQGNEIVVSSSCGKGCADRAVTLQKRVGGAWKTFAHTRMNDRGRHNFTWDTVTRGTYKMRVVVKNWAKSRTVSFDVVR